MAAALALLAAACSDVTTSLIDSPAAEGDVRDARTLDDATSRDASSSQVGPCGDRACACNDGQDQDGDALVDGLDPECTGLYDDDESSFGTGHPDSARTCQDCFWDDNNDGSDDGCAYPLSCSRSDTEEPAAEPACAACVAGPTCIDRCRPRTPNGCDCFGCCQATARNGVVVNVLLTAGCTEKNVDDAQVCPRCTPQPDCRNDCGECELCLGRKRRDLPQTCRGKPTDPEPTPTCDSGEVPCSDTQPCPPMFYCQLGCCLVTVF